MDIPTDTEFEQLRDEFMAAVARKRQEHSDYRAAMEEHFAGRRTEASADRAYLRYRDARRVARGLGVAVLRHSRDKAVAS